MCVGIYININIFINIYTYIRKLGYFFCPRSGTCTHNENHVGLKLQKDLKKRKSKRWKKYKSKSKKTTCLI